MLKKSPLRLISSNTPPKPPDAEDNNVIKVTLDDKLMIDIVSDGSVFRKQLENLTDATRIYISVNRDFITLQEILTFRHVIGHYIQTLQVAKDGVFNFLREVWHHLYDLMYEAQEDGGAINLELTVSYNVFGVSVSCVMSIDEEIVVYDDQRYFDTFTETPLYLLFGESAQQPN